MGFLDRLTGTRRPEDGATARSAQEVRDALRSVASADAPYTVTDTTEDGAELLAQWRVEEPEWRTRSERHDVERLVKILMRLDEDAHEVTWTERVAQLDRLRLATTSHGWTWKTVPFGKL